VTQGHPSEKRRVVRNTLSVGVAQAVQILSAFVFMPLLIGGFGILNYGVYLLVSSLAGYAAVLDLGLGPSLARLMAECRAKGDTRRLHTAANTALAYYIAVGVAVAAVRPQSPSASNNDLSADEARMREPPDRRGHALLAWPLNVAFLLLAGAQRHDQIARVSVGITAAGVLGTAAVLWLGQGPVMLMGVTSAIGVAGGVVSWAMARQEYGPHVLSLRNASIAGARDLFAESWAISIVQLCSMLLYQQTDRVVLGVFLGAAAVGLYERPRVPEPRMARGAWPDSCDASGVAAQRAAAALSSRTAASRDEITGAFLTPIVVASSCWSRCAWWLG
jgi:O-antigen/teichoic acid export membrane protein